jgi:hypothetical protein
MEAMVHRLLLASVFVAASAVTALAQAPGEYEGAGAPGNVEPQVVANPCGACRDVMATRWAVGLSVGSFSVAPKDTPDASTDFGVGQLALRYRATYHLELELAVGGGTERLMDGSDGSREVQTVALGARYRFAASRDWNWWLMGALGSTSIADRNASDQQRQDQQRPLGEVGLGLERRFDHLALQAELRALGTGPTRASQGAPKAVPAGGNQVPPPPGPAMAPSDQLSGGELTIGASYYF